MLEQKLQEELNRYKAINKYGKTMIMEQDAPPPPPPPADSNEVPADPNAAPDAGMAPADPNAAPDAGMPPMDTPPDAGVAPVEGDTTEEIDITDLVDMTKSIKNDLESNKVDNTAVVNKMDDVFTKLTDLETKLAEMNQIVAKIDELGAKVEKMKPETPVEKLEMRSLDSYPFNEKPQEFFAHKQGEMQASGKNEYVLTKDDVQNYPMDINKTFNPKEEEDEYKF